MKVKLEYTITGTIEVESSDYDLENETSEELISELKEDVQFISEVVDNELVTGAATVEYKVVELLSAD